MHPIAVADELAEIRAEIARLEQREAQLRDLILATPPALRSGRWYKIEVIEHRIRHFDPSLLPAAIRDNPAFWRERLQMAVRTLPVQARASRPGWPIRRAGREDRTRTPMH